MTTPAVRFDPDLACSGCGQFGAYVFDGEPFCGDCYQSRGSCCAERDCDPDLATRVAPAGVLLDGDTHRVSANCCYQACPGCSYLRRLREFQSRFPRDWRSRLRGSVRAVQAARDRE